MQPTEYRAAQQRVALAQMRESAPHPMSAVVFRWADEKGKALAGADATFLSVEWQVVWELPHLLLRYLPAHA